MNHSKTNAEKIIRTREETHVETHGKPSFATKTIATDVLIVGAGPAGAAAAITLARAGREVLIIDQHNFPRDKICGDGLIPDALQALAQLGVLDRVRALATPVKGVTCHGPKGGVLDIPSELAVLPRKALDQLLVQAAIAAGATFLTPYRYVHPVTDGDRTVGAIAQGPSGTLDIKANWTILATGATVAALQSADHCTRDLPSAMALRGYVHNPTFKGLNERLHISWHKSYAPGYGWIFPCPDGVFNIGVGLYGMHATGWRHRLAQMPGLGHLRPRKPNLNALFKLFVSTNPLAQSLMQTGTLMGDIKGAPLRCSLEGAKPSSAGLLVTGEAVGCTYALTGEGIGKAMETGILAAQSVLAQLDDEQTMVHYETALGQLTPKFDIYRRANLVNRMPWLIELAIKRGNKSPKLVKRMSLVLEEKANPSKLFTARGAWKFLTE
jgi:geranylgeranyl reductase family protein